MAHMVLIDPLVVLQGTSNGQLATDAEVFTDWDPELQGGAPELLARHISPMTPVCRIHNHTSALGGPSSL